MSLALLILIECWFVSAEVYYGTNVWPPSPLERACPDFSGERGWGL